MSLKDFFFGEKGKRGDEYYDSADEIIEAEEVEESSRDHGYAKHTSMPMLNRLKRLRKVIDPDGTPKSTMSDEADYLADFLGLTYPVGATLPKKVEFLERAVLGLKGADNITATRSIGSDIDRMVFDLGIVTAPGDDTVKKLESVEKHLGIDSDAAAEKPLVVRVRIPYEMLYGASR